jgi:hypothetical protein
MDNFYKYLPNFRERSIGEVLSEENKKGQQLIEVLADLVVGDTNPQTESIVGQSRKLGRLVERIQKDYSKHPLNIFNSDHRLNTFNPLIEVFFMIMRGHNDALYDVKQPDAPACADGAYLHALNAIGEIQDLGSSDLSGLQIIPCGAD